jgi:protein-L-isoaspartate(D-aspartate) O-methyltransferase
MTDFERAREEMVERQIAARRIDDPAILAAFRAVPRERFVPAAHVASAYDDSPVPIEAGQTVSQPFIVAVMIKAAAIGADSRVLEIGAGSGYAAAVIGRIAARVIAIERHGELARLAVGRMRSLGYANVEIFEGDGSHGWPAAAPYDAILVPAAARHLPEGLADQLAIGGRLVIPVGPHDETQRLLRVRRLGADAFEQDDLGPVRFISLVGI